MRVQSVLLDYTYLVRRRDCNACSMPEKRQTAFNLRLCTDRPIGCVLFFDTRRVFFLGTRQMIVRGPAYDDTIDQHFAAPAFRMNEPFGTLLYDYEYVPICHYHRAKYRRHLLGKRHQRKTSQTSVGK